MLTKIISGGQSGVDRAALDIALELGIDCGGWCPRGRLAEDGAIPERYPLTETGSRKYPVRTAKNVLDSDATLILTRGQPDRGTALTLQLADERGRPVLCVDLTGSADAEAVVDWLAANGVKTLNVAGPRESSNEGIYAAAYQFLREMFARLRKE